MKTACRSDFHSGSLAKTRTSLLVAAALLAISALLPGLARAVEEVDSDGVLHVKNGAAPSQGVETLQLEELWRAGGEDDEDVLFGAIVQVLDDDEGNLYLLDSQLSEVQVFSPDGEFLHTLSREGEGPGEVRTPGNMLFLPDGSLGLVQRFPGKIIRIDLEGNPLGNLVPGNPDPTEGGILAMADGKCDGGNTVLGCVTISIDQAAGSQDRSCFIASFDAEGNEQARYGEINYSWAASDLTMTEQQMFWIWQRWNVTNEGRVLIPAKWDSYAINVFNADGSLERVIERDYSSYARTDDDPGLAQFIFDRIEEQTTAQGIQGNFVVEKNEPDVGSIHAANDGSIWVLSSHGARDQAEGIMATFDVFDSTGKFIKQVLIPCEGDAVKDGLFIVGDDRIVVVTGFIDAIMMQIGGGAGGAAEEEATPMEVICYKIL